MRSDAVKADGMPDAFERKAIYVRKGACGMKLKTIAKMAVCAVMIGILAGCGTSDTASSRSAGRASGVEAVLSEQIGQADADATEQTAAVIANGDAGDSDTQTDAEKTETRGDGDVDIDLTKLSSTMVYSEVYDMMNVPQDYIGKVVKMNGTYMVYNDEETGSNYFACLIADAAACCQQGIEFVLNDSYSYPQDYPQAYDNVTVMGVFDTYMEGDYEYCTLRDATLVQ